MPKNTDAAKSKMRLKSTRKPLRDVSNAKTAVKSANFFKRTSDDAGHTGDYPLDNLLLVHSDVSSLLREVDDLVVQALKVTSNKGRQEIKQFADVLLDMRNSLKPWVPRFQKALLSKSMETENKLEQSVGRTVVCEPKESTDAVIESPELTKWESLISPSPLVSWRAECNTEGGRQLFLLTPLPQKKAFSYKYQASSTSAFEKIKSDDIAHPVPLSDSVGNMSNDLPESVLANPVSSKVLDIKASKVVADLRTKCDSVRNLVNDLPESVLVNPIPNKVLDVEATKAVVDVRTKCRSPAKLSKTKCSMSVMTPCSKMSPPKSCILLEPTSALYSKKKQAVHQCTPFPARFQNHSESLDSESSSSQSSDDLKVKYPELFGIKIDHMRKRVVAEDSPSWIVSPPKTCAIMEPSDEKLLKNLADNCLLPKTTAVHNQQEDLSSMTIKESHQGDNCTTAKKTTC